MKTLLISIIVICLVAIGIQFNANRELKKQNIELAAQPAQSIYIPVIDTIRDTTKGETIFKFRPVESTLSLDQYVSKGLADTLADALRLTKSERDNWMRRAKSYEAFTVVLQDSLHGIKYSDGRGQWAHLKDKTFDIRYNIDSNIWIPKVNLTARKIVYPERKSIFQQYRYNAAWIFDDDRVQISNLQDYTKVKQPSRWGISAIGGPVVTPNGFTYGFGLGLSYDIISF
ncbi:hypothetical protein AAW12_15920 [Sphingobacterium sp. Ag1]|uniref:hypothetical protein n=1 Tax=Sphingobacterium sp. Ag1 TaxID=1643451 RepID=UPI000628262E|nr:hypothetical protein [Sphingobacterium sp. Ag1]KKO90564.1 hypothetical protein AAW12_15920 [Sphingobacterium sp. Ag1]